MKMNLGDTPRPLSESRLVGTLHSSQHKFG